MITVNGVDLVLHFQATKLVLQMLDLTQIRSDNSEPLLRILIVKYQLLQDLLDGSCLISISKRWIDKFIMTSNVNEKERFIVVNKELELLSGVILDTFIIEKFVGDLHEIRMHSVLLIK